MSEAVPVDRTPGALTPYLRLDEVLLDHAHLLREALRANFIGLYPLGSLAIGDFDLTSDVDFVVVTETGVADGELDAAQSVIVRCWPETRVG